MTKSTALLKRWSPKYRWVERCREWDAAEDRRQREEFRQARKDAMKRHLATVRALQTKGIARLAKMDPEELSPGEVLNYIKSGILLERIILGVPDSISEVQSATAEQARVVITVPHNSRGEAPPGAEPEPEPEGSADG